jgi:hypothetical protein
VARLVPEERSSRTVLGILTRARPSSAWRRSLDADRDLAIALARDPAVRTFASELVRGLPESARVHRLARLFSFVAGLVEVRPPDEDPRDGVDVLLALAGETSGPAVILSALLRSLGTKASLRSTGHYVFVVAELREEDVRHLPPHAALLRHQGSLSVPLDPRHSRTPFGFLPRIVRLALSMRPTGV